MTDLRPVHIMKPAPYWASHRTGVVTEETAPLELVVSNGLNGEGWRRALVRFRIAEAASGEIELQPLFWDEEAGTAGLFVADPTVPAQSFDAASDEMPGSAIFDIHGRIFVIALITNSDELTVDIDVCGAERLIFP